MSSFTNNLKGFWRGIVFRIPAEEKVIFARHLAIMAKAGMPIIKSLELLQKQAKSRAMKKILVTLVADVNKGQFLADSLEKFHDVFGDLFINLIRVGESAGLLSENLSFLADELKKGQELKKKVIGAMIYPLVILAATFGITGLLTIFIFPKILPVFSSLNVDLPATTKFLIAVSHLLTNYGGWVVLALAILAAVFLILLRIKIINYYWNWLLLHVPFLKSMIQGVNLANFSRTLGLTLKSEVKIVEAISITAKSIANPVYQKELLSIAEEVKKGEVISKYIIEKKALFPPILAQMISVGENTGNLSDTLLYLSEFYESEVSNATKNLSNVLEPILMVVMGVVVGFVAISILTPIYQVTQTIGR